MRRKTSDSLYGDDEGTFVQVGTVGIPIEFIPASPEDLSQKIDATANVLPNANVLPKDRLTIGVEVFRIQTVDPVILFGATTHLALKLVRHAG